MVGKEERQKVKILKDKKIKKRKIKCNQLSTPSIIVRSRHTHTLEYS
jgi:hypothetical protein